MNTIVSGLIIKNVRYQLLKPIPVFRSYGSVLKKQKKTNKSVISRLKRFVFKLKN